jgi:hypothetical protein
LPQPSNFCVHFTTTTQSAIWTNCLTRNFRGSFSLNSNNRQ